MNFHKRFLQRGEVLGALCVRAVGEVISHGGHTVEKSADITWIIYAVRIAARRTIVAVAKAARVRAHHRRLLHVHKVDIVNRLQVDGPLNGFENGFSPEEINGERKIILHRPLFTLAEKFCAQRSRRADGARRRDATELKFSGTAGGEVQKNVLADDRRIALEIALQIRMPELWTIVEIRRLTFAGVTPPRHERHAIAIRHRQ